ncbi:tetratricopeptide repeat protein [Novimethylophilus sp.]|uniref:tetratricopeptide repeat protein n=1 Tax=Novimethylophilus sp. TaxID=2137426 RepID=UPI0039C9956B
MLDAHPDQPAVLHFLGLLHAEQGNFPSGIALMKRSIAIFPAAAEFHNNLGSVYESQGDFKKAEQSFQKALERNKHYPEAWNNLGNVKFHFGKRGEAEKCYLRAIAIRPDYARASLNLAKIYSSEGRVENAIECYRNLTDQFPGLLVAWQEMGKLYADTDRLEEAIGCYRKALAIAPENAEMWDRLGGFYYRNKMMYLAVESFSQAVKWMPDRAEYHINLGIGWLEQEVWAEAIASFGRAIVLNADSYDAYWNLGRIWMMLRKHAEAITCFEKAAAISAKAEAFNELGNARLHYAMENRLPLADAAECYLKAIGISPDQAIFHCNLGYVYMLTGALDLATQSYFDALDLDPTNEPFYVSVGHLLQVQGRFDVAIEKFRQILVKHPDYKLHSYLIWYLDRMPGVSLEAMQAERKEWDRVHIQSRGYVIAPHQHDRNPDRRLRVGVVSGEFYHCSATYSFLPFIEFHDRTLFEVTCYSNTEPAYRDGTTQQIVGMAERWRDIYGVPDAEVAQMIREDNIDILLDISAHSWTTTRLPVFGQKPAPIQVSGWGYASGTGMKAMDYLLSDKVTIRPEERHLFAEEVAYLPCVIGYSCPDHAPPVGMLPADRNAGIVFGCLNHPDKLSDEVLELWAELLLSRAGSTLLLKYGGLEGGPHRQRIQSAFKSRGIEPERVIFQGKTPWYEHMDTYNHIDICLDPFPSGGGVTSYEALWMGCPVVTLTGDTLVNRSTASILSALDLHDWIAGTREGYLAVTDRLADDLVSLRAMRASLRQRLLDSAVSHLNYVRAAEKIFRAMWIKWSEKNGDRNGASHG